MTNFAQGGNLGTFDILFIMMFWTYPEKITMVPFFSGSNSNALGLLSVARLLLDLIKIFKMAAELYNRVFQYKRILNGGSASMR